MTSGLAQYDFGDVRLSLEVGEDVFKPTSTSRFLIENAAIREGSTVLDMGCGIGPVAIMAAKKGAGRVYAVDIMERACDLAVRNMAHNGVSDRVTVLQGDLFEPVKDMQFDVIIDDVSGMAEEPSRISGWYPAPVPTGGMDGTEPTLRMLREAPKHLTEGGVLYFPLLSLANAGKLLSYATEVFGSSIQQVFSRMIPFCKELQQDIKRLDDMRRKGLIDYVSRGSRSLWHLRIFKASAYETGRFRT